MWLDVIRAQDKSREAEFEEILSHHLPVVVYGTGEFAKAVSISLESAGAEVYGFAVDAKYFNAGDILGIVDGKFLDKPVFVWEEIKEKTKQYVFVLGFFRMGAVKRFLADDTLIRYALLAPGPEHGTITRAYLGQNQKAFNETYGWLSDDLSRKTFCAFLNMKISRDISNNFDVYRPNQYFNELTNPFRSGTFVDCGAYDGDTVEQYIEWSGGEYTKIYAFEPDAANRMKMVKRLEAKQYKNVEVVPFGAWDSAAILKFSGGEETESTISLDGEDEIHVEAIDNVFRDKCDSAPLLIKMDIEGSELPALKGAKRILADCFPALAICVYHKREDLITIPQFIKSFENEHNHYDFYLRKHGAVADNELVLYALPISKE